MSSCYMCINISQSTCSFKVLNRVQENNDGLLMK
jgi:hypothetical protein